MAWTPVNGRYHERKHVSTVRLRNQTKPEHMNQRAPDFRDFTSNFVHSPATPSSAPRQVLHLLPAPPPPHQLSGPTAWPREMAPRIVTLARAAATVPAGVRGRPSIIIVMVHPPAHRRAAPEACGVCVCRDIGQWEGGSGQKFVL